MLLKTEALGIIIHLLQNPRKYLQSISKLVAFRVLIVKQVYGVILTQFQQYHLSEEAMLKSKVIIRD